MSEIPAPWWVNPARTRVVWPVRLDRDGVTGPTRVQARGKAWRRSSHGFYVPADAVATPEQRIVEAASLMPTTFSAVTGWAALRWLGGSWFDGLDHAHAPLEVDIVTGNFHVRRQAGVRISEERLSHADLVELDGLVITSPVRSVWFMMRHATGVLPAVRAFDMAAYSDLVTIEELAAYVDSHGGWTGTPLCREALDYCDENAWSPREPDLHLAWRRDAGLPRPLCNVPIFDRSGNPIGTPDILDVEAGVAGEYDGTLHLEGAQRARDVLREAVFRSHTLEYFTMLAGDLSRTAGVVQRMREARTRAAWLPESQRSWTITPPAGWQPTLTVAQRRQLSGAQRECLLAIRRRVA